MPSTSTTTRRGVDVGSCRNLDHVIRPGATSRAAQEFCNEMKSYMRANHKRFVKSQENAASHHWAQDAVYDYDSESDEDAQECHNKGRRTWLQDLDDFFARWNGPWWKEGCVVHYCRGLSCCSSFQDSAQRLTSSAEKVLFRSIVPSICASTWS